MAVDSTLKIYTTTAQRLPDLPQADGNLIFIKDNKKIYFDVNGSRLSYNTICVFHNDIERTSFICPLDGFYFVEDTNILWRYSNQWIQITPNDITPIFFGLLEDFPSIGQSSVLYISKDAIYHWNDLTQEYDLVSNKTIWEDIK